MPKKFKGENSKATAAKVRKAAVSASQNAKSNAEKEAKAASEWSVGSKVNKREEEEVKKAERAAKKAEAARLLAEEEAKASERTIPRKDTARKPAAAQRPATTTVDPPTSADLVPEYSASGLDAALELLDLSGATGNSMSTRETIDRHPERRAKAAWLAYRDSELESLKKQYPGLRLSQLNDMLWKSWQKSPLNPFNQATLAYNATASDEVETVKRNKQAALEAMRAKN